MNLFRPEMRDSLESGRIRCFRNSTTSNITYRYFITDRRQLPMFWNERLFGTPDGPNKAFHVYVDDDVDKSSRTYTALFQPPREANFPPPQ